MIFPKLNCGLLLLAMISPYRFIFLLLAPDWFCRQPGAECASRTAFLGEYLNKEIVRLGSREPSSMSNRLRRKLHER
jgi:hypothetical protein